MREKPVIILATHNAHKAEEIAAILGGVYDVRTMKDYGIQDDIVEDGATIQENADIKVCALASRLGGREKAVLMADDTGLFVDALGGAPGVYSARYAGEDATYQDNNDKLLAALEGVPPEARGARFQTCIALITPDGQDISVTGTVDGAIAEAARGADGFGYDPLFIEAESGKTYAEMSADEKNAHSHRRAALNRARAVLEQCR